MTVVAGAVRSILPAELCAFVLLPALSVAVALAVSAEPSPPMMLFAGLLVPDRAQELVEAPVAYLFSQPLAFGGVVGEPDSVGATLSMFMPPTVVLEELSALS